MIGSRQWKGRGGRARGKGEEEKGKKRRERDGRAWPVVVVAGDGQGRAEGGGTVRWEWGIFGLEGRRVSSLEEKGKRERERESQWV